MSYFNKVLIANRGEIARRIISTCRKLGIKTVAVYSDADADAPFVKEADEAYFIGPAQAKKSYLDVESVLDAAKKSKAEAIHPGYGFLSENPDFVKACEDNDIVFIGPDYKTIDVMGRKIEARKYMRQAGVPIVPGWDGKLESADDALRIAEDLGYPLMLKASAGGGGIGMHVVHDEDELKKVFSSAKQRASSAFGDDSVFLERYIANARHIEVQVFGDHSGNAIHLFERECTIQRRNQKVVEESPSSFLNPELRKELCGKAVKGVKKIGYTNAGTMEFVVDDDTGEFYFLEMNTRLQVEHPVTEKVTGLDLVELQLKIAAGEELGIDQSEVRQKGYAIETRLYAEDPKTYFPSPGTISKLNLPKDEGRFDFAVEQGDAVTPFYDPMIGKIIAYGEDRAAGINSMERILDTIEVEGITTNLQLLKNIVKDRDFKIGKYTTSYLEEKQEAGAAFSS